MMFEAFSPESTMAAFWWVDHELSLLPPDSRFTDWWVAQDQHLRETLPGDVTGGRIPKPVPDDLKADLSTFVLLEEVFYELTHGPAGGMEITVGETDGILPSLEGGWGLAAEGGVARADDVLRWSRGWREQMLSSLGGVIADVQIATGAEDVEVAPGVRMRISPEHLAQLKASAGEHTESSAEFQSVLEQKANHLAGLLRAGEK
jgi:hypothetical protein